MTFSIARSVLNSLPFDYVEEVERFRQAKLAHRFTGNAAPHAPDIVEQAVRRVQHPIEDEKPDDFVADFEIVEDVQIPTPQERKAALVAKLRQAEADAMSAVISPARERLLALDVGAVTPKENGELSAEAQSMIDRMNEVRARKLEIHRYFVNLEIEVEELPEASIDGWTFKSFAPA